MEIILSSTYVSFLSSATCFQYIHLPVGKLPVRVYWVRASRGGGGGYSDTFMHT